MADAILAQSGIYAIRNKVNGKQYVGSAVNLRSRLIYHFSFLSRGKHANSKLQRAWIKYGADAFEKLVLEHVSDVSSLVVREQHWIDTIGSAKVGYNIRHIAQSNQGLTASEATKAKMSASQSDRRHSDEARAKISAAKTGKSMGLSDEDKARWSAIRIGRKHSAEARAKIAEAGTGRKRSPKSVQKAIASMKLSASRRPKYSPPAHLRQQWSDAKKGKPAKNRKPVVFFGVEYVSIAAAAVAYGRNPQWIKVRIGKETLFGDDIHAKPVVSEESKAKRSAALKGIPKSKESVAKRMATNAAKKIVKASKDD